AERQAHEAYEDHCEQFFHDFSSFSDLRVGADFRIAPGGGERNCQLRILTNSTFCIKAGRAF
ncbi:MAG: hypothetical protein J6U19_00840, partial [Oscillospiraceae bacterium]|nr:hypothetical protein [Oscillospiraceae bacterium]